MDGVKDRLQNRTYRPIHRKWPKKARKATAWLMPFELVGLIPLLVMFGLAQPDLYRTKLWRIGFENKLNSNPNMILYAYANHASLPDVPLVWSSTLTSFNVAISVISLFFLLTKLIAFIMKLWLPAVAIFTNIALVALYGVSVYGQIGPDYADSRYPAPAAWYFRQGCGLAKRYGSYSDCQLAQASLGVTMYMFAIYIVSLGFAGWAMWPSQRNDVRDSDSDASSEDGSPKETANWEMQNVKASTRTSSVPFTPRTQAFHMLDRRLPLRQQADQIPEPSQTTR